MAHKTRYIDVNVFVYWLGSHPKFIEIAKQWITRIEESPREEYFTSALTLYEALVVMGDLTDKNFKDKSLVASVIYPITHIKGLTIEPLKPEDFAKAFDLMSECRLDYDCLLYTSPSPRDS